MAARDFMTFHRPPSEDFASVQGYFHEMHPVSYDEEYIYSKDDLATLKPELDAAWLDKILMRALIKNMASRFTRVRLHLVVLQEQPG